ncbi:MAG: nicotinamide-nucleotide amidohydrolase family protein [Leptospiraceae bacterium]|nr:nicotinamide-nucleotide amidohydrolase family protein [Leptospiraceae bacterium]MDW8305650.1 nicotinamide-nucleotide amidohydrolase family protein [Leptospiraceae bacterium]
MELSGYISLCITGSEVLNGFVLDTNTRFFASEFYKAGFEVRESRILRDDPRAILNSWEEFYQRGDIIVNAGGLGPTRDDLTVDLLCQWLNRRPVMVQEAEEKIRRLFQEKKERGMTMKYSLEVALRQARIPEGCIALPNPVGLAPGIFVPEKNFFALPGFPIEIEGIWPSLWQYLDKEKLQKYHTRELPVWSYGESALFAEIHPPEEIEMGVHALPFGCRLFFRSQNERLLDEFFTSLKERYYGLTQESPLKSFAQWAMANNKKVALAESCTGGLFAKEFTDIPGISAIFLGGVVSYANEIKMSFLGLPEEILKTHGAVSAPCAKAMAEGALLRFGADISVSFTGIAGPGGGTPKKPVGTLYIGLATKGEETLIGKFFYDFGRARFRQAACATAALVLYQKFVLAPHKNLRDLPLGNQFLPIERYLE